MPEYEAPAYTIAAVAAPLLVVACELLLLRTGLLRTGRYWLTIAIVLGFQVPVDGWLTRPDAPVVHYSRSATTGLRAPWDIPVEDFGFGFALVTLTLLIWRWYGQRAARRARPTPAGPPPAGPSLAGPPPQATLAADRSVHG